MKILAGALLLGLIRGWFLHEKTYSGSVGRRGSRELSLWSGGVGGFFDTMVSCNLWVFLVRIRTRTPAGRWQA